MPPCPGCPRFGSDRIAPQAIGRLRELGALYGIEIEQVQGARQHFRRRARLSVRGRSKSPKIGVFEAKSHLVADIPHCSVHHPSINTVIRQLKASIQKLGIPPYSDRAQAGLIRGVQVVVQRKTQRAQVSLIGNSQSTCPAAALLSDLQRQLGDILHSLWWNGNTDNTNRVLGPHWEKICGPDMLEETLGGAKIFFPPGAFGQNNLEVFEHMVAQVHRWVPDGSNVVELYCGTGSLGLGLLRRVDSLVFNEIGEASLLGLQRGLAAQSTPHQARVRMAPGSAESARHLLDTHQIVIVDPPRKGMEDPVVQALCERSPRRLIYVSCGLDSFIRDAQRLAHAGLIPRQIAAYDLFPFTDHVETVALFEPES